MYKTKEQKLKFYKGRSWRQLRLLALRRDNHECQQCKREGKMSKGQNVHHIKEIYHYPQHALELDNLETLCISCHNKEHDRNFERSKKKKWNDERWD